MTGSTLVDVDEHNPRPVTDHVGRQRAVPAQRRAQRSEVLARLRQVQAELVAGAAARPLADPLAGVERDQLTAGEHRLDHDQRPVGWLLHQDAARPEYSLALVIDEDFAELLRWLRRALPVPGDVP